jgi:hypothetical protein
MAIDLIKYDISVGSKQQRLLPENLLAVAELLILTASNGDAAHGLLFWFIMHGNRIGHAHYLLLHVKLKEYEKSPTGSGRPTTTGKSLQ